MAFPSVVQVFKTSPTYNYPYYSVQMPATVNSGELLLLIFAKKAGNAAINVPTGWTGSTDNTNHSFVFAYKTADGSEGGTTINVYSEAMGEACAHIYRLTGWNSIEYSPLPTTGSNSTSPNPPSLTPTYGAADTLWIAAAGAYKDAVQFTAPPAEFTNFEENVTGGASAGCSMGSARYSLNSTNADPGPFTLAAEQAWQSITIAVEGTSVNDSTPPTVSDGTLSFSNITGSSVSVDFAKATDDISSQNSLVYKLYRAASGVSLANLADIDANGTLVDTKTDVAQLTDIGLTAETTYEYNVVVTDEAGNRTAYTQNQVTTAAAISGVIRRGGVAQSGVKVAIFTSTDVSLGGLSLVEVATTDANGVYAMATAYSASNHYVIIPLYFHVIYSGTAESGTVNTLTDTALALTASELNDLTHVIRFVGGTGAGQERVVSDNGTDSFTVQQNFSVTPDATTVYEVGKLYSGPAKMHVAQS